MNFQFDNVYMAVFQLWNWGWTFQDVKIKSVELVLPLDEQY